MAFDSDIFDRANRAIAQGALTNSKHPHRFVCGSYPTHIKDAYQCFVVDTKDEVYTDYICGLGTNLIGYGNYLVESELEKHKTKGHSHSLPTIYEVEAAEKLKEAFVFVDKFKFLKTGSEACSAAIKIARAHTGKPLILSDGYHGWGDEFISLMEPALGVCGSGNIRKLNEYEGDYENVAAIIVEPVTTVCDDNRRQDLSKLRDFCDRHKILLIFDEVITGFRFPKLSVANYWGIEPDLIIIGKAMANGRALSAIGGKAAVMDNDYFVSSTYAGEIQALIACKKVTDVLFFKNHPQYDLEKLWERGQEFIDRFNSLLKPFVWIEGYPTRGVFKYANDAVWGAFLERAIECNILLGPSWFYNFDLTLQDYKFFEFAKEFKKKCDNREFIIKGKPPTGAFATKARS